MSLSPIPSQADVQTALRSFLLSILPDGIDVIEGQDNRVAEPSVPNFVVMTPIRRERLETNIDTYSDCAFIGSIDGATMIVTAMRLGTITIGHTLFGISGSKVEVAAGTTITGQISGDPPGGIGTYSLSIAQTLAPDAILACGIENVMQPTKITIQLDVHSDDLATASDMAQTISTLFRDDTATLFFFRNGYAAQGITPLYADDPRQIPFINDQSQYETRWIVEACLQANQVVKPPMQFADELDPQIVVVEAAYPAT